MCVEMMHWVARERETEVGYFVCEEGSEAVSERYLE